MSLEAALRHWSDPEDLQEVDQYKKYSWRVPLFFLGTPPSHGELMHEEWCKRRDPLEKAFIEKLRNGELITTALQTPLTITSHREVIARELWDVLEPDFVKSEARGPGIHLIKVEVLENVALGNADQDGVTASDPAPGQELEKANHGDAYPDFQHNRDFTRVTIRGRAFRLGPAQSNVVRLLHAAALSGGPWVAGKLLLEQAGSKGLKLPDLFKRHQDPSWRELIEADGRGFYRLNLKAR